MFILFEMVGAAFVLVMTFMSFLWLVYYFRRNASIVDIGWTLSFILVVIAYGVLGNGAALKKITIASLVAIWAMRLAWYLTDRYLTSPEDIRYQKIREGWGNKNVDFKFFLLFLFQGLIVIILSLPFLIVCHYSISQWTLWELWAVLVWIIGVCGEFIADAQLQKFKQDSNNARKVCQVGLWYYSRHPNYFFEWIVWIGYFLFAMGSPWGILAIISPIMMYILLLKVSGVQITEKHLLSKKGEAYRDYQITTNAFFPWFKRS